MTKFIILLEMTYPYSLCANQSKYHTYPRVAKFMTSHFLSVLKNAKMQLQCRPLARMHSLRKDGFLCCMCREGGGYTLKFKIATCRNQLETLDQCFRSVFIEHGSGSSQKSQSGSNLFLNTV